ncbi:hypothetical protein ACFFGH_08945 [Lysobacter korlensis]|uniref:Uncharacterized protein n=1 Tax=Lysobacter korlensis TaxID=553636 RepID=A0ABV6RLY1_9GAMM
MIAALQLQSVTPGARPARSGGPVRARAATPQARRARLQHDLKRLAEMAVADSPPGTDAVRVQLVRVMLQHELGEQIREHPEFGDIADRVAAALAAEPALDARFLALVRQPR